MSKRTKRRTRIASMVESMVQRQDVTGLIRLSVNDSGACEGLVTLGMLAIPPLLALLRTSSDERSFRVRASAAYVVGRIRDPGAVEVLVGALDTSTPGDGDLRSAVLAALSRIGDARAGSAVVRLFRRAEEHGALTSLEPHLDAIIETLSSLRRADPSGLGEEAESVLSEGLALRAGYQEKEEREKKLALERERRLNPAFCPRCRIDVAKDMATTTYERGSNRDDHRYEATNYLCPVCGTHLVQPRSNVPIADVRWLE